MIFFAQNKINVYIFIAAGNQAFQRSIKKNIHDMEMKKYSNNTKYTESNIWKINSYVWS